MTGRDHLPRGLLPNNRMLYVDSVPPYRAVALPLDLTDPDHPKAGPPEILFTSDTPISDVAVSPDGKWLAYVSNESGVLETIVRPASSAKGAGRWLVSSGGGGTPFWSRNSRELLYQHRPDGKPWVVAYTVNGDTFVAGKPRPWLEKLPLTQIPDGALSSDGKRFALFLPAGRPDRKPPAHVTFLLNFADELKRRVPVRK